MSTPGASRVDREVADLEARLEPSPHQPKRPTWICRCCHGDVPWPCAPARVHLAELYVGNRIGLAVYLGSLLYLALAEMPTCPPSELFERFVAWTR